jgi:Ca-activated chloride channel family protein
VSAAIPDWLAPIVALLVARFDQPWALLLAVGAPIAVLLLLAARQRRRRARLARLASPALLARLLPSGIPRPPRLRAGVLAAAAALAGVALAGPRWGEERTVEHGSGIDVVLALDASLSMTATDERPSRLQHVKEEVRRLRDLSPGDRTALIAFAGRSYILTPLTVDDGAIDLFLENLDPSVVGQPGTALARAIRQGTELLGSARTGSDRALVLMSDGEGFDDEADVEQAARDAGDAGISVVTVGFGTTAGSTIPIVAGDTVLPKRDENGQIVVTHYSPHLLAAIAEAAHGTFIPADATDKAARIHAALAHLRAQERLLERGRSLAPRYQWFLAPAILLVLLDTLASARRRRPVRVTAPATSAAAASSPARPVPPRRAATPSVASLAALAMLAAGDSTGAPKGATPATPAPQIYREAIGAGDRSPRTMYNYGTSLLAADSLDGAVSALTLVASDHDAEVRYRALFNLGLAHLRRAHAASGDAQRTEFDAALTAYKHVLLMRPGDADATWNYELALRARDPSGGGGGGAGAKSSGGGRSGSNPSQPAPGSDDPGDGQLGKRQAEELLQSAAREERDVAGRKQRQNQTDVPPLGRDW